MKDSKRTARITAFGSYLPEKILSNRDLEQMVDTSDEWIFSRTGMRERRIAAADEACSDMAIRAAKEALKERATTPEELDLILVATSTPDHLMPNTASIVQAGIGAVKAAAFDLSVACTGFIYGLSVAKAYIESGIYKNILLIAVDKMSAFVDYEDRNTCVLFGDAASAVLIQAAGSGYRLDSISLGADGTLAGLIIIPAGGSRLPCTADTLKEKSHTFRMSGKEVFKHAVRRMNQSAQDCLKAAQLEQKQISWLISHQANERIIDALAKNFDVPPERVGKTVHKYGNTSAPSLAVTLEEVVHAYPIQEGEHLLLVAFGSGLTWGAAILTRIQES